MAFRIRYNRPPAAASGKKYGSLDERCKACRVMGGTELECVDRVTLREIKKETGRPCPRVELDPSLVLESKLITVMLNERGAPFAAELLRVSVPERERAQMIYRLMSADGDPRVVAARKIALDQERGR